MISKRPVVHGVLGEDPAQVLLAEDQHPEFDRRVEPILIATRLPDGPSSRAGRGAAVPGDAASAWRERQHRAGAAAVLDPLAGRCDLPRRADPPHRERWDRCPLLTTREQPAGRRGYRRRIDQELLADIAWPPTQRPLVYVCGPTNFVETAATALVTLGHEPGRIRLERFGGTGGST